MGNATSSLVLMAMLMRTQRRIAAGLTTAITMFVPVVIGGTVAEAAGAPIGPAGRVCAEVRGASGAAAVVNLTPVDATGPGNGQLISSNITNPPDASNVNYAPGTVDPNVAIATIGNDGRVCYTNSNHHSVHIIADHLGTITNTAYTPATNTGAPARKLDTREGSPGEITETAQHPQLGSHPAFVEVGVGNVPVDCQLPAWDYDAAGMRAFYAAAIDCHHASWTDTFTRYDFELKKAGLWAGAKAANYDGACSEYSANREAFYCPADDTIVMPFDTMDSIAQYGAGYALAVLSHEHGHHLQGQFGMFEPYTQLRTDAGWYSDEGLLLSRQLELQAWCLSGMFYGTSTGRGSITTQLRDQAYDNNSGAGDRQGEYREHGTNENIAGWFWWGVHPSADPDANVSPSLYECNPWAARDLSTLE